MICEFCNSAHSGTFGSGRFCNRSCSAKYADSKVKTRHGFFGQRNVKKANATKLYKAIERRKTLKWEQLNSKKARRKRVIEEQLGLCNKCKLSLWNGIKLVLEYHHIDGNSKNDLRKNVECLCPNCHSQTYTFRFNNFNRKTLTRKLL